MRFVFLSALLSWLPMAALSHSLLTETVPAEGATVAAPVEEITLVFGDGVEAGFATLALTRDGVAVDVTPDVVLSEEGRQMTFDGLMLDAGAWVAEWSAISADGHRVEGSFAFTVSK